MPSGARVSSPSVALPPIPERFLKALRNAVDLVFTLTNPDAVLVCGTIVNAGSGGPAPDPNSDLDIQVVHDDGWRQRVQRRIDGIPCEVFINPADQVRRYFSEESASGRPRTAHMFAHGDVVFDPLGRGELLAEEARQVLVAGWRLTEHELTLRRYHAVTLLDDARDVAQRDPVTAELLLSQALNAIVEYAFAARGRFLPRPKERTAALAQLDRPSASMLNDCYQGWDLAARVRGAERFADRVLGVRGFFEWLGAREPAASSGL